MDDLDERTPFINNLSELFKHLHQNTWIIMLCDSSCRAAFTKVTKPRKIGLRTQNLKGIEIETIEFKRISILCFF